MSTLDITPEARERILKKIRRDKAEVEHKAHDVTEKYKRITSRLEEDYAALEETERFWMGE